jgi:hypothetical protein
MVVAVANGNFTIATNHNIKATTPDKLRQKWARNCVVAKVPWLMRAHPTRYTTLNRLR